MNFKIGDIVYGKVSGIRTYGVFVKLDNTDEQGLIHISECKNGYVPNLERLFQIGQRIKVMVLDIDEYTSKISLSIRALEPVLYNKNHFHKKHYWTNYKHKIGFQTIADIKATWVKDAVKDME